MNEMAQARYKNLKFIQKNWNLSDEDLCVIFRVEASDLQQWHRVQSVTLTSVEAIIVSLMRLYEVTTDKFKSPKDQIAWLTTAHPSLDNTSPIQSIADDPKNAMLVTSLLLPN